MRAIHAALIAYIAHCARHANYNNNILQQPSRTLVLLLPGVYLVYQSLHAKLAPRVQLET